MNSKEALNDLIDEIKHTHNNGKTLTNYDQKRIDIIAKDLEVLEILKKNTDVELLKANENAPIFVTVLRIKPLTNTIDKEYEKVKEWLKQ